MHVHLREPGQEHKETVATGRRRRGWRIHGVACMPNTDPVNDNAGVTEYILKKAAEGTRVYPVMPCRGSERQQPAEIAELSRLAAALTDDGRRWRRRADAPCV